MELSIVFIGLFIGSFLNVCIYRIPKKESIVWPGSHCPYCNKPLKPYDLIPVISFLLNRGHCRYCKSRISLQYPIVELLTGFVFLLVFREYGLSVEMYLFLIFSSFLIIISGIDLKHRIIPDVVNFTGLIIGLVSGVFFGHIPIVQALLGALVGGGIFLLIAVISRGGIGGGDIKMMAFIGSFLGVKGALLTIFLGSLFGSLFGFYLILFKKAHRKTAIPYGPFLALGAFIVALYSDELVLFYLQLFM